MSVYDDIIGNWGGYDIVGQQQAALAAQQAWPQYPFPLGVAIGQNPGLVVDPNIPLNTGAGAMGFPVRGGLDPRFCGPMVNPPLPPVDAVYLEQNCPTKFRRELLGFDRTCIGPCETVTLTTSPQVLCKPYRLIIPSSIAYQLVILDVTFGKWRLFANGGCFPAAAFIETQSGDSDINPDTVQCGCNVSITLQNISNEKLEACIGFWCKCVE